MNDTVYVHLAAQGRPLPNRYDPRIGSVPGLWVFLFGCFYLAYKGLWSHAIIYLLLCWTFIVPVIYIFKTRDIIYNRMLRSGQLN